jgi:hypothetical protein
MRLVVGCVVVLCAAVAGAGCKKPLTPAGRPGAPTVAHSLAPAITPDGLFVESVLLERPVGDALLDRDLWAVTVPAGAPEARTLLTENGLRAGVLGGNLPQQLQDLLESDADAVDPRGLTFNLRKEAVLPTAGPLDPCKFSLLADLAGEPKAVELKHARCGILLKPQPAGAGRVRVWCEPRIQHGERRDQYRPNEDGTEITKTEEAPLEKFPTLGFEVTLGPEDCLVIGWSADQPDTLGAVLFGVEVDNRPRQRVLVIRARQMSRPGTADLPVIAGPWRRR